MIHRILIAVLFSLTFFGCGKMEKYPYQKADFRPELSKHIQSIISENVLLYNPDTLALNFLKDSCTKDELLKLLNFENPLVRVRAFRAIVNRNEPDYFQILLSHLDDTTKVMWWYFDDVADEFMVSDLMIRKVERERKLSRQQKDSLIDEVLTKHSYLETAEWMIHDIEPQEKYYPIVKQLAQKRLINCHDLINTYSLAKYKKPEDIDLIKKNFNKYSDNPYCNNNLFKTFEVFPDTTFFPMLTKYFNEVIKKQKQQYGDDLKYYCRALVQYKTKSSLELLIALTKKETYPDNSYLRHNQENVFKAIHKHKAAIYDSLYNALKPQMNEIVLKYIDNPDRDDRTIW
jgi:hypothetical protein